MPELLGTASFPSGDLLLIDFGLLRLWSGDQPPLLPEEVAPAEVVAKANAAADFEIVGPQAAEAVARLNLAAVKGRYAFDLPHDGGPVAEAVARTGLAATVRQVPRMPHHTRVLRLLDDRPDGVEVPFHGVWAVAVRGLPAGPLRVLGERMGPGPDQDRWHSVWVECAEGKPAESVEAGYVLVDEARLMFADPTALTSWVTDEPADGLVDLAFWGADEEQVAARLAAPAVAGEYLWTDLTVDETRSLCHRLESLRGEGLEFAFDLRPHDDHYRVLKPMRSSATESGGIEVGGALMTGWFTSWGDGAFPVYRDLAEDGTVLRVRVELGGPETVARRRRLERLYFGDLARMAIVSARVARDGASVGWLYRDEPDRDQDSGWRVFAGDETQEYTDDARNATIVPLRDLIDRDPALEAVFEQPPGSAFERVDGELVPARD